MRYANYTGEEIIESLNFTKVHEDERRAIYANSDILPDNKEVSIIKLHKGKAIGGCIHDKKEYFVVLDGIVSVDGAEPWCGIYLKGESGVFQANTPHMFKAMEDSIIMEWGISAEDKFNNPKDPKMLEDVKNINAN